MPTANSRRAKQLPLAIRTWGGARRNAGRKPNGDKAGVAHLPRTELRRRLPLHVTLRMAPRVYNLRSRRSFRVIDRAMRRGANRFDVAVIRFSVQGNHIHLLVEAADRESLARAMKGLSVRIARGMNRLMGTSGRVIGDRYHSRVLLTPSEVRNVVHYLSNNHRRHVGGFPEEWIDPLTVESGVAARTWLLRVGWRSRATDKRQNC